MNRTEAVIFPSDIYVKAQDGKPPVPVKKKYFKKKKLTPSEKQLLKLRWLIRKHRRFVRRNRRFMRSVNRLFRRKYKIAAYEFVLRRFFRRFFRIFKTKKPFNKFTFKSAISTPVPRILFRSYIKWRYKRYKSLKHLVDSFRDIRKSPPRVSRKVSLLQGFNKYSRLKARFPYTQTFFSGYKPLKYLTLFSKKGNTRFLVSSFFKTIYKLRLAFFLNFLFKKNLIKASPATAFVVSNSRISFSYLKKRKSLRLAGRLSLLYRRHFCLLRRRRRRKKSLLKSNFKLKFKQLKNFSPFFYLNSFRHFYFLLNRFYIYVEVKPWKKGGRAISVPLPIKSKTRRAFLFAHWFKDSVYSQSPNKSIGPRIFNEFLNISRKEGPSIKKLHVLSKVIKANRSSIRKSGLQLT